MESPKRLPKRIILYRKYGTNLDIFRVQQELLSPIWSNGTYLELVKLQHGARWKKYGIIYLRQLFHHEELLTFDALREAFKLPIFLHFYYMQLRHAIIAQSSTSEWTMASVPLFSLLKAAETTKGSISQSYNMLLHQYLKKTLQSETEMGKLHRPA